MGHWMSEHHALLGWLAAGSVAMLILSIIAVPMIVVRIPSDYFARGRVKRERWPALPPAARLAVTAIKNVAGYVMLAAGLAMLVLPGQGVLTILAGLALVDFPGKRALERWIVMRAPVRRAIDALRVRAGHAPLDLSDRTPPA